jgi:glycosyltransferase involved in cell wall biosynthesis
MKENKYEYFDYSQMPGISRKSEYEVVENKEPVISIVTAFWNGGKYLEQTANSILNQTYPYWEWLIVDDGSTDEESLRIIENVSRLDSRIRLLHKENGGLAETRDYGAKNSNPSSKYFVFLDEDDLIDKTYLECAYWTLETNPDATWAYTDVVNFDGEKYIWKKWFEVEIEKKENLLVATAMIRKNDFWQVNGYELREKKVNEDWNLWLKFLAKGFKPVRMNINGFWYRRKPNEESELYRSKQNKTRANEIIQNTAKTITKNVEAIQFPFCNYNWDIIPEEVQGIIKPQYKENGKINILMVIPWMTMGGADKFNLDLVTGIDKNKFNIILVCTVPNDNVWRQKFEKEVDCIYDLTTFLDQKYWLCFIDYLIYTKNISLVFNTNSVYGYAALPYIKARYPQVPIIDYIHMEEWYNRNGGYSRDSSGVASVIDHTYVCNQNSERILVEHFERNPEEVSTVYIGVDEKKFDPETCHRTKLLEKFEIPQGKKVISFIARIDLQKRPHLLMKVIKELNARRNDFMFVIAGDGPLLYQIKNEAKQYGVNDIVKFLGAVSNTKEIYSISDVTLNCSIKEGLALTAYESLSMGVPVVSADVGGQKELINEETGVIVPCLQDETEITNYDYSSEEILSYVDALEKVLDNIDYYKSNCRDRILNGFTIDQMIVNMSNIFENTVKNPNYEKIRQGQELANNIDITKELVTKHLVSNKEEYSWLCTQYNKLNYETAKEYKHRKRIERLWGNPLYRGFFKFCKAIGIVALIKKLRK